MAVAYGHIERTYSINSKKDTRVSSLQFCQLQTYQKWYQMQFLIMIDGSQMQAFTLVVKRLTFNPEKTFLSMNKVILLLKSNQSQFVFSIFTIYHARVSMSGIWWNRQIHFHNKCIFLFCWLH